MNKVILALLALMAMGLVDGEGDFGDFSGRQKALTEAEIAKYFSDQMIIDGDVTKVGKCSQKVLDFRKKKAEDGGPTLGVEPTVGLGAALIIFLMVGLFAAGIAQAFQMVRRHVYHDADNLDTAFDAGGKVSIGLTATTIVSQWTWSATLLQSSTVASKVVQCDKNNMQLANLTLILFNFIQFLFNFYSIFFNFFNFLIFS